MKLEINEMWSINNANIDIGKINIIGGNNSTGKSTTSKLLYCFLKSGTEYGKNLVIWDITKQIDEFLRRVNKFFGRETYEEMKEIVEPITYPGSFHPIMKENVSIEEVSDVYDKLIEALRYGLSRIKISKSQYDALKKMKLQNTNQNDELLLKGVNVTYNDSTAKVDNGLVFIIEEFVNVGSIISLMENEPFKLYEATIKKLFKAEFNITKFNDPETYVKWCGDGFSYCIHNDKENKELKLSAEGEYEFKTVHYLDSFSILDTKMERIATEHTDSLKKDIQSIHSESNKVFDEEFNRKTKKLEETINQILHGKIEYEEDQYKYSSEDGVNSSMINTASGIKQIGIIQLLLSNRKLKPGSFFIVDEPEVNLHPEWQIKLSQILVLLASELNVIVYINSHSPFVMEALSLYSEYYGIINDANFYLTEKDEEKKGKYNMNKIEHDEINKIYDNLGRPYDILDEVRIDLEMGLTER